MKKKLLLSMLCSTVVGFTNCVNLWHEAAVKLDAKLAIEAARNGEDPNEQYPKVYNKIVFPGTAQDAPTPLLQLLYTTDSELRKIKRSVIITEEELKEKMIPLAKRMAEQRVVLKVDVDKQFGLGTRRSGLFSKFFNEILGSMVRERMEHDKVTCVDRLEPELF